MGIEIDDDIIKRISELFLHSDALKLLMVLYNREMALVSVAEEIAGKYAIGVLVKLKLAKLYRVNRTIVIALTDRGRSIARATWEIYNMWRGVKYAT
ncbi:MAG: hypothetical protein DRN53_04160 [Thermoprotei archaeon]|nr:MAG: hypothetical protein DRN53_04160 [Thermoprotei archaeon]